MQMDYLLRMCQVHESFRQAEIDSIAKIINAKVEVVEYDPASPFCILRFHPLKDVRNHVAEHGDEEENQSEILARKFISLSILAQSIYELWGSGSSYPDLHANTYQINKSTDSQLWGKYKKDVKFRFEVDSFYHKRSEVEKRVIINEFAYLGFEGKIDLKKPDHEWGVLEEWVLDPEAATSWERDEIEVDEDEEIPDPSIRRNLKRVFLGRKIGVSSRRLVHKHDLKKRPYISTTSMDAELALVTATVALAAPGKLFLDPFVGTGGFMIAAAEWGALTLGSDIDGRSFRGNGVGLEKGVGSNFRKYGLKSLFGDCIISDLTNTPFRDKSGQRWLDGMICDPPYGVREGLKVLGMRQLRPSDRNKGPDLDSSTPLGPYLIDGIPAHTLPGYIAPKRPYSFERMLDDILDFATRILVDGGRLAFWMPSANENEYGEEETTAIPMHRLLALKYECVQRFNKWSRRLLVYERKPDNSDMSNQTEIPIQSLNLNGTRADELNPFRRRYFQGFSDRPNG